MGVTPSIAARGQALGRSDELGHLSFPMRNHLNVHLPGLILARPSVQALPVHLSIKIDPARQGRE
jgi:sorbitol-specific phosphotransferase system component IIA